MAENSEFDTLFSTTPLMAILRGMGAERSLLAATAAWDHGIDVVELPIQTGKDIEALRMVSEAARRRGKRVGAGTVITTEHVVQAAASGADFTVSPGFDLDIVKASCEAGLPPLPGVATPTEVQIAMKEGLTWLKAFPASLFGPKWLTAMRGPFPTAKFVVTGGIDAENAAAFLDAGARVAAIGSALKDESQLPRLAKLTGRRPK